jgi:hypothetical protein
LVVLLLEPVKGHPGGGIDEVTLASVVRCCTGLGEVGDVGGVAGVDCNGQASFELLVANIVDGDAGRLFKGSY